MALASNNLTTRDIEIFNFLWKWKLVSTLAIAEKFFPGKHPHSAYKRLELLRKRGLLKIEVLGAIDKCFWTLTDKSYAHIKEFLPEFKEDGFKSECLNHDYWVTAIHLGDWLFKIPSGSDLISEQELRRLSPQIYPNWLPDTEFHRPDGYWFIGGAQSLVIALEVELSQKKSTRYENLAKFYDRNEKLDRVIWLTPSESFSKNIFQKLTLIVNERAKIHHFISLKDFAKNGWNCTLQHGYEAGRTLAQMLQPSIGNPSERFPTQALLTTKKTPYFSSTSFHYPNTAIPYSLGI